MMRLKRLLTTMLAAMLLIAAASGHAGVGANAAPDTLAHQQSQTSGDVEAYLQRARLASASRQWQAALMHLDMAEKLDATLAAVWYWRAKVLLSADESRAAANSIDRFLDAVPGSASGWRLKAKICHTLQDYAAGAAALDQAIRLDDRIAAKTFLNRAYLQELDGQSGSRILVGLDQALQNYPGDEAVLDRAIKVAQKYRKWERAEHYWRQVPETLRQQPAWLLRRASLSAAKGDSLQAEAYARESLSAWQTLPRRQQQSVDMRSLKSRIDRTLVAQD